jgi:hypothetical protein
MPIVKVITLTQPWASLMYFLEKRNETRGWGTVYRGPLAIHAAKGFKPAERDLFYEEPFFSAFQRHGVNEFEELPLGAILCVLGLQDIQKVDEFYKLPPSPELDFGGYGLGRKIWSFEDGIHRFDPPIPAKGKQSLWEYNVPAFSLDNA